MVEPAATKFDTDTAIAPAAEPNGLAPTPAQSLRLAEPAATRRGSRRAIRRALVVSDTLALAFAFVISFAITQAHEDGSRLAAWGELGVFVASIPIWLGLAKLHHLYDRHETAAHHSTIDDIVQVIQVVTLGSWLFLALAALSEAFSPGIGRLLVFWLVAIILIPAARGLLFFLIRRDEKYTQSAIIIGAGDVAHSIAGKLEGRDGGIEVVGFLDRNPFRDSPDAEGPPLLGMPEDLPYLVQSMGIDRVVVAFSGDSHQETLDVIRSVADLDVRVDIVPRLFEVIGANVQTHFLGGIPLLAIPSLRLSPWARALKRTFDLVLTAGGLIVLTPLFVATAIAIKIDSRGPVFFKQQRRGEGERIFTIYKFRTMSADAEERKAEIAHLNIHRETDPRMFKAQNDPRITKLGSFLRRSSIDELPQLFNVLRGDMSLVGPRPLILEEDQYVLAWARKRLALKPGITGLWQVLGRSDIPFDEMTKLDYLYVSNWSIGGDLRIIGLTVPALFRARRAL